MMQSIAVSGLHIHYQQFNVGCPQCLVFINSLGTDWRIWQSVVAELDDFEIIVYDKRGHGLSDVGTANTTIDEATADLAALLNALDRPQVALCGVSVGGMIALNFAAQYPARVSRLILSNTSYQIGTAQAWQDRINTVTEQGMAAIVEPIMARWFSTAYREQSSAMPIWRNMLKNCSTTGYVATCAAIRDADLKAQAQAITAPTLVLAGGQDQSTPPEVVQALAQQIKTAHYHEISGVGHLPSIEAPQEVARLLRRFLIDPALDDQRHAHGMQVRRSVLGHAHVDRAEARKTDFDLPFQAFITEYAWGSVWARPGLSRRQRSLLTIALMAALGHEEELAMHFRAARNTGASWEQIQETLLQVAIYAGVPAANIAFRIAKEVIAEQENQT